MIQAEFRGALGQAFTDQYGNFAGTLEDIWHMPLHNNFRRAIFIATLNAVLRSVNQIDHTIHCRDQEPAECAVELATYIRQQFGVPKLGQVGFQPRMIETLAAHFPLRVLDMDPERIGTQKAYIPIEAPTATADVVAWADVLLVTGTTLVNDTLPRFLHHKPTIFYGTTIAAAGYLMGWERFCVKSR